jgi:Helix-turn-helix domain
MTRPFGLEDAERITLTELRDHGPHAYLRERAAALLKVDDGIPAARVAREGLLRPRQPDTVYAWLNRYLVDGLAGLYIRPGRGRKPAFSPSGQ